MANIKFDFALLKAHSRMLQDNLEAYLTGDRGWKASGDRAAKLANEIRKELFELRKAIIAERKAR